MESLIESVLIDWVLARCQEYSRHCDKGKRWVIPSPGTSDLVEKGGKETARDLAPEGHFSAVPERTARVLAICCALEKKNARNQQTLQLKWVIPARRTEDTSYVVTYPCARGSWRNQSWSFPRKRGSILLFYSFSCNGMSKLVSKDSFWSGVILLLTMLKEFIFFAQLLWL